MPITPPSVDAQGHIPPRGARTCGPAARLTRRLRSHSPLGALGDLPWAASGWGVDIGLLSLALPMAILIVLSFCMFRRQLVENAYVDHEHSERARRRFRFGVCLSAFGIASWIGVESGCAVSAFFVWYPGHVVFHVLISVGVTNMCPAPVMR